MATANLGRVGFVNKGTYSGATAYKVNDVVTYNGGTYACVQAHTGQLPTATAYWQNWVANDKALDSAVVHKTGDETKEGVLTLSDGLKVQGQNVSPFSGFKNYIINGKKTINQRALTSTDNSYNQDRWYKVGNNWYQGIEGDNNLISGKTYTLSWTGAATASYYVGTATSSTINAQSFTTIANGANFTPTITAGKNLWIKFISDANGSTFNYVQLEEGSVATPFENRPYGLELSLCQRYYEVSGLLLTAISGDYPTGFWKVSKRTAPTISLSIGTGSGATVILNISADLTVGFYQNTPNSVASYSVVTASAEL